MQGAMYIVCEVYAKNKCKKVYFLSTSCVQNIGELQKSINYHSVSFDSFMYMHGCSVYACLENLFHASCVFSNICGHAQKCKEEK